MATSALKYQYGTEVALTITNLDDAIADSHYWKSDEFDLTDPSDTELEISYQITVGGTAPSGHLEFYLVRENSNGAWEGNITPGEGDGGAFTTDIRKPYLNTPVAIVPVSDAGDDVAGFFVIPSDRLTQINCLIIVNETGEALNATQTGAYVRYRPRTVEAQ